MKTNKGLAFIVAFLTAVIFGTGCFFLINKFISPPVRNMPFDFENTTWHDNLPFGIFFGLLFGLFAYPLALYGWRMGPPCDICHKNDGGWWKKKGRFICDDCQEIETKEEELAKKRAPQELADKEQKINCKNDGAVMDKMILDGDLVIDVCPTCKNAWLDAKEFVIIEDRLKQKKQGGGSSDMGCVIILLILILLALGNLH